VVPDFAERALAVQGFYGGWTPAQRSAFLDREDISHVILPAPEGPGAETWLGTGTPFREVARARALGVYRRR